MEFHMQMVIFAGRSDKVIQVSSAVHVGRRRSGWHRLSRGSRTECITAVPGHARIASRTNLCPHKTNQQECTFTKIGSPGIHTKIA